MLDETTCFIAGGKPLAPPPGLDVRNFRDPTVHRFTCRDRTGRPVTEVIVHESVTRSAEATVTVLRRRGLGVHLVVAPDGRVTQHGDLANDRLAHASGHNGPSIGIEVVTPYYGDQFRKGLPWSRVIDAPWEHRGRHVVPTPEQAEATAQAVAWLSSPASGLSIPRAWIGLAGSRLALGRIPAGDERGPGIWAHTYFHHADGAWLVLYAWLRLEAGLAPPNAFDEAVRRATGARRHVDLGDLAPPPVA